jgi:type IV pilus assembly protein PilB
MGCVMTDVDAIRWRASEHDLEFIDLDTYGVDPAAREILPAPLSRRLQVAAVKRRFGTPVIATADPDDLMAQDSVRAALGRDFISVVATNDQIGAYLDRLYGSENSDADDVQRGPSSGGPVGESRSSEDESTADNEEHVDPPKSSFDSLMDLATVATEPTPAVEAEPSAAARGVLQVPDIEPLAAALPPLTTSPPPITQSGTAALAARAEELARTMRPETQEALGSTDETADLVHEAVSSYQEQFGDPHGESPPPSNFQDMSHFPALAKALVEGSRVSLSDMESVLEEHAKSDQSVARILTARGLVTEADLMWGMAEEMGLEFVDLDVVGVNFAEVGIIPESTARHHNVIVIASRDGTPVVAASNPTDVFAMDDLRTIIGRSFIVVVATRSQITSYIGRAFNSGGDASDMAREASLGIDGTNAESGVDDIQAVTEEAPIVRYVNLLILQALNERASDIHIEPTEHDLRIRYRIDGVLHDVSTAPRSIAPAVTTRLKVMADMNIAEHRIPQDGRISLNVGSKGIDLRMATLPTIYGEKVVMRVLDKSSVVLGFADLGFEEHLLKTYAGIYTKPYGTILVTGPTGSGKSTTLYTTLTALNSPEKNIITVEDPVELPLKGVNQVQLNLKAGLNFASALRAILRSDPDIVLVGEIRDKETAVIAIEAALTGHMVLATLHTNNAASTPMRLIEMGLEPFLVTSSVSGVLAQRLARRLCMHCKQAYEPTEAEIVGAGWSMEEVQAMGGLPEVFKAVGCSACANTGYRGRKALAELLPMSEEIDRSIIEGGSVDEIHRIAVSQGMTTLRQSGLRKAMEGETTLEEVLRVVA